MKCRASTLILVLFEGCATGSKRPGVFSIEGVNLQASPRLREQLRSDPYVYFRAVNQKFTNETCKLLADHPTIPTVHLHGDCHLEQYVVTDDFAGLSDFDDAALGPAHLDLVRLGTSIYLAAHQGPLSEEAAEQLLDEMWRAYWRGIDHAQAPIPTVVHRFRSGFDKPAIARKNRIAAHLRPIPQEEASEIRRALEPILSGAPNQSPLQEVLDISELEIGVGSALSAKFLVHLRDRAVPGGEEFLEVKEVSDLGTTGCLPRQGNETWTRIRRSQATFRSKVPLLLGAVTLHGRTHTVQRWFVHYRAFAVRGASKRDLFEVTQAIAVQLGSGHFRSAPRANWAALRSLDRKLKDASRKLADEVTSAWKSLRSMEGSI